MSESANLKTEARSHVLITYRDRDVIEAVTGSFESEGFAVSVCPSLADFLSDDMEDPDIIVVDITEDSRSIIHTIALTRNQPSPIPVIVTSDYPDTDVLIAALNAGAEDYMIKPFSSRELVARVKAILRRYNR